MPNNIDFFWLFFKFSGRVNRAAYMLGFLFMLMVVSFPLYQFMRVHPDSSAGQMWSFLFGLIFLAFLWAHVAFSVKRLHDIDRPGLFAVALFIPIVSIFAFVALCFYPGMPGPKQFGEHTNAPR